MPIYKIFGLKGDLIIAKRIRNCPINGRMIKGCKTEIGLENNFVIISNSAWKRKVLWLPPHSKYPIPENRMSKIPRALWFIEYFWDTNLFQNFYRSFKNLNTIFVACI